MSDKKIACYLHPTAVAAIDDQQDYLNNLIAKVGKNIYIEPFSDAFAAVESLKKHAENNSFLHEHITSLKDREDIGELERENISHAHTSIDVFNIHKIIYDANRFKKFV